jgi:hypothetical protein
MKPADPRDERLERLNRAIRMARAVLHDGASQAEHDAWWRARRAEAKRCERAMERQLRQLSRGGLTQ